LHFDNVTIIGHNVVVSRLIVDSYLQLGEGTAIRPPDGESIQLRNGLTVRFVSRDLEGIPRLNLGLTIGYEILPDLIDIVVPESAFSGEIDRLIIEGNPFDRCSDWAAVVRGLPPGVAVKCERYSGSRKLQEGDTSRLYLWSEASTPKDPKGLSGGAIAGIVIAVIVVFGASAGFAYWWFVVKGKTKIGNVEP
jgi:hypothetical protein